MIVSCTLSDFVGYEEFNRIKSADTSYEFFCNVSYRHNPNEAPKRMHFNSYFTSNSKSDNHLSIKSP